MVSQERVDRRSRVAAKKNASLSPPPPPTAAAAATAKAAANAAHAERRKAQTPEECRKRAQKSAKRTERRRLAKMFDSLPIHPATLADAAEFVGPCVYCSPRHEYHLPQEAMYFK
jgi:hypothetical protein